jgi:hypothetical protein
MTKRFSLTTVLLFLVAVHNPAQAESLGPPATMTTVGDMGARIPIHGQGSVTITAPGSYYLTSNINVARVPAIIISSANVTVDLNGFTLTGNLDNLGVVLAHDTLNVVVRNGTIRNFAQGLINAGTTSVSLSHLTIADSLRNGVGFDAGSVGVFIDDCTIVRNQQDGILALGGTAVINNSTVASNGFDGIDLNGSASVVIRGNRVDDNGRSGIHAAIPFAGDSAPAGAIVDNVLVHNGRFGIETFSAAGTFPDLSIARNLATNNALGNYLLTGTNAAPVSTLTSNPGAWDNVQ